MDKIYVQYWYGRVKYILLLSGNSAYGSLIMDKTKHRKIEYVEGEESVCIKVNNSNFQRYDNVGENLFEVQLGKKQIRLDLPIQLGYFVLQYAKLRMLAFYYDCVDYFVDRKDYIYCEMDTDSAYMSISGASFGDIVKPDKQTEYQKGL